MLAADAANVVGRSIVFVAVTAALAIDTIESEINEIWGIRKKRPIARRILVYLVGITAGPVMVGAAISLIRWTLAEVVAAVPLQRALTDMVWRYRADGAGRCVGLTLLYRIAPARHVRWRYAIASGVLAGIAFEVTKRVFTWYLTQLPELRDALWRAGGGSGAAVLDIPELADRARGRGRDRDARGSRRARK